jgi:glycosyltransferase involved in cell wall biosynthesis
VAARTAPGRPIGLDITPALRQRAGVGRYARELAKALLERDRFPYVLFNADRPPAGGAAAGLGPHASPIHSVGVAARWLTLAWYRLGRGPAPERWTGPLALYHSLDFLAPPGTRAPVVLTVHDLSFLVHPARAEPKLERFLARAVPRSVRRAAHVLADSEHTRQDLVARLGLDPRRASVAYPGVEPRFRRVADPAALGAVSARYGLTRPFVLGVGTLEPRKDWPVLMEALARAGPALADHALLIAGGEGWGVAPIREAAARAAGRVRLLGYVPDEDLPALYSLADAFAYPSVYEGFGLPPLEAMACGAPTVVSTASCLPEVVGDAALAVSPGDAHALSRALVSLVTDAPLRARLVAAGPQQAARFTWPGCAAAVEAVYARLLGAGAFDTRRRR